MNKALIFLAMLAAMASAALPASAQVSGSVRFGPPPARYERIPGPPGPGYVWQGGEWFWNGNRYVWHNGHYVRHERGRWIPAHWRQTPRGWVRVEGHWAP
jgi:hypothetical protein